MIIDEKKTALAYRCPSCYSVPTSMVGLFSLSGDLFKLKCSCGGSEMTVEKLEDNKLRLTVPCLACPNPHIYTLTKDVFFNNEVFVLPCAVSAIDLCFMGKEHLVSKAVELSNQEILTTLGDATVESLKSGDKRFLANPQILDIVTYVVHELNDEGKIYCGCQDGGDYECNIYDDFITVKCKKCKKSATIPADSTIAAYDFLEADKLTLS